MYEVPEYDMYKFIDDGTNRSIYTILSSYHPSLRGNFSLSSLLNNLVELGPGFQSTYKKKFCEFADILQQELKSVSSQEENGEKKPRVSEAERQALLDEFRELSKNDPEAKLLNSIGQFLLYAKTSTDKEETKPLRDAIIEKAIKCLSQNQIAEERSSLIRFAYLPKARDIAKSVNHKRRIQGQYPEFDLIEQIIKIIQREGLEKYDAFYNKATEKINKAVMDAMKKTGLEAVCVAKRENYVLETLSPLIPDGKVNRHEEKLRPMFARLNRLPVDGESKWEFTSYKTPKLLCDIEANYSENGEENQRVIVYRYGRFNYENANNQLPINLDVSDTMPELVGITRSGKDRTSTYFVLMPPIARLTFREANDKTREQGDRIINFVSTQNEQETNGSSRRVRKIQKPTTITDLNTGKKLNLFINETIPEHLQEFYAKIFFSDEYLQSAILYNARYIGRVVETKNGPTIQTADETKMDLQAAHYAQRFPGIADGFQRKSFEEFCRGSRFVSKQFNLVYDLVHAQKAKVVSNPQGNSVPQSKDDDAVGLDD